MPTEDNPTRLRVGDKPAPNRKGMRPIGRSQRKKTKGPDFPELDRPGIIIKEKVRFNAA